MPSESNKSPGPGGDDSSASVQPATEDSGASDTNNSVTRISSRKPSPTDAGKRSSYDPPRAVSPQARPGLSLDCNDNPDDDTDEDLANIPLDYGRSEGTKALMLRIQTRWQT